jgi:hypothetical protein
MVVVCVTDRNSARAANRKTQYSTLCFYEKVEAIKALGIDRIMSSAFHPAAQKTMSNYKLVPSRQDTDKRDRPMFLESGLLRQEHDAFYGWWMLGP